MNMLNSRSTPVESADNLLWIETDTALATKRPNIRNANSASTGATTRTNASLRAFRKRSDCDGGQDGMDFTHAASAGRGLGLRWRGKGLMCCESEVSVMRETPSDHIISKEDPLWTSP